MLDQKDALKVIGLDFNLGRPVLVVRRGLHRHGELPLAGYVAAGDLAPGCGRSDGPCLGRSDADRPGAAYDICVDIHPVEVQIRRARSGFMGLGDTDLLPHATADDGRNGVAVSGCPRVAVKGNRKGTVAP